MKLPALYEPYLEAKLLDWVAPYSVEFICNSLANPLASPMDASSQITTPDSVKIALAFAIQSVTYGHVGIDLEHFSDQLALMASSVVPQALTNKEGTLNIDSIVVKCPSSLKQWSVLLSESPLVQKVDSVSEIVTRPFVLDSGYLLTSRYYAYVCCIIRFIKQRLSAPPPFVDVALLRRDMLALFGYLDYTDLQQIGVASTLFSRFTIISGGPGTGKTFTVKRMLVAFYSQFLAENARPPIIAIAAPTGKAAVRLGDILATDMPNYLSEIVPVTLHRLLSYNPYLDTEPLRNRNNPIEADLVIVDEVSMVDISMMAHLLDAIVPQTRLILLGDKNQLASVEAGTVLADLINDPRAHLFSTERCEKFSELFQVSAMDLKEHFKSTINMSSLPREFSAFSDCFVQFQKPYRMKEKSGIQAVAYAIINNKPEEATTWLTGGVVNGKGPFADLQLISPCKLEKQSARILSEEIVNLLLEEYFSPQGYFSLLFGNCENSSESSFFLSSNNFSSNIPLAQKLIGAFTKITLLTAYREKTIGVKRLNQEVEQVVLHELFERFSYRENSPFWIGRPIMILENMYSLGVMNGDVGVVVPGLSSEEPNRVLFVGKNSSYMTSSDTNRESELCSKDLYLSTMQLPKHETAFAMTVHKSQGSEFGHVLFILPEVFSPLLTRELIYTAVTRAKEKLTIYGEKAVLQQAIKTNIFRASHMGRYLWGTLGL